MKLIRTLIAIPVVIGALTAGTASAQDFEGFWKTLMLATKAGNFQQIRKMVEQDQTNAERAFFQAADHYVTLGLQGSIEEEKVRQDIMQNLGNAFYIVNENGDYTKYTQFLTRLNLIKKEQWSESYGKYVDFMIAYYNVDAKKEGVPEATIREAVALADEPLSDFEDVGDYYLQGIAYRSKGVLLARLEEFEESKRAFELAKACFSTFGSETSVSAVELSLNQLAVAKKSSEVEEETERDRADDAGEQLAGEAPWTSIAMEYKADKRGLGEGIHPYTVDEYLLWTQCVVRGSEPGNFADGYEKNVGRFSAYYTETFNRSATQSSLLYPFSFFIEDNKITLDMNDDGRVQRNERLKVSSRPTFVEFEDLTAKSGGTFDYAVEMVDIGQETWFGQANSVFANPGNKAIAYRRSCHLEGDWDGKRLYLVDDNSNANYSDIGADTLYIKGEEPAFFGKIMRLSGSLVEVRIPDGKGSEVKIRPFEGETGLVEVEWKGKVDPHCLFIRDVEGKNALIRLDLKDPVAVPVGKYEFYFGWIKDGKSRNQTLAEIRSGRSDSFDVKAGETYTLKLGSPFEYAFSVTSTPEAYVIRGRDLELYGASGELYTRFYGQTILPKVQIKRQGGGMVAKESMRLIEFSDRENDPESVWFPKDLELDKRKAGDGKLEAKFTASSKLLGTIRTDWVKSK